MSAREDVDAPWARVTPREVQQVLAGLPIRWWIAGGWALDMTGALPHSDINVAVLRPEHELLREYLAGSSATTGSIAEIRRSAFPSQSWA
jgi:hypothetical protein